MRPTGSRIGRRIAALGCMLVLSAGASRAVINGVEDNTGAYRAVGWFAGVCSAVLVAPRVMLTSGHCMAQHALSCTDATAMPLSVTFAEQNSGWTNGLSFSLRTVNVMTYALHPGLFDSSQCAAGDPYGCGSADRESIDHSNELVVLYLDADAPPDVTPLPILIHPGIDSSDSAAEVGVFLGMDDWIEEPRLVTTVGHGVGSHLDTFDMTQAPGRDYGLQQWVATSTNYNGALGASSCTTLASAITRSAMVVSPEDLTVTHLPYNPDLVPPGEEFDGAKQSHSGTGDSGGPVLVGAGLSLRGNSPSPLPPTSADNGFGYDPSKIYVAGTGSNWVLVTDRDFATAYNPTWTVSASQFLMTALHDSDGDDYADVVDDDLDNDGCANDVDDNPHDRWVPVGRTNHPNCTPSWTTWFEDESIDSDGDGLPNCLDRNDDDDMYLDVDDDCPIHDTNVCERFGQTCPWNRQFFDCRVFGCDELLLRYKSLVNPDPTRDVFFRVLSVAERIVTVAPADGLSLAESARVLATGPPRIREARVAPERGDLRRGPADRNRTRAEPSDYRLFALEVVGPVSRFGEDDLGGLLAAFERGRVRIGNLRGANALELRFGKDGRSLEIVGVTVDLER